MNFIGSLEYVLIGQPITAFQGYSIPGIERKTSINYGWTKSRVDQYQREMGRFIQNFGW